MFDLVSHTPYERKDKKGKVLPCTRVRRLPANKYSPTYMDIVSRAKEAKDESR